MTEYACLMLPFPPSTNALWRSVGRKVLRSKRYREWMAEADRALMMQKRPKCFIAPVSVTLSCGVPDKRKRDIDNVIKPIFDCLERCNILENDNLVHRLVAVWDREVTGVRVEIEPAGASQ